MDSLGLGAVIPAGLSLLGTGWVGNIAFQWFKNRGEIGSARLGAEAQIAKHRDEFLLELLSAARAEVAAAKVGAAEFQGMATRLGHFEEALDHIAAMLAAASDEETKAATRRARAFLNRMRRLSDARGTIANEEQRERSLDALPTEMRESIGRIDDNSGKGGK